MKTPLLYGENVVYAELLCYSKLEIDEGQLKLELLNLNI